MDKAYSRAGLASLVMGIIGGARYESLGYGVLWFFSTLIYHSLFISAVEPMLAHFWGEAAGEKVFNIFGLKLLQWGGYFLVLAWFFSGFGTVK
jgi:hypothetical protein